MKYTTLFPYKYIGNKTVHSIIKLIVSNIHLRQKIEIKGRKYGNLNMFSGGCGLGYHGVRCTVFEKVDRKL